MRNPEENRAVNLSRGSRRVFTQKLNLTKTEKNDGSLQNDLMNWCIDILVNTAVTHNRNIPISIPMALHSSHQEPSGYRRRLNTDSALRRNTLQRIENSRQNQSICVHTCTGIDRVAKLRGRRKSWQTRLILTLFSLLLVCFCSGYHCSAALVRAEEGWAPPKDWQAARSDQTVAEHIQCILSPSKTDSIVFAHRLTNITLLTLVQATTL